MPSVQQTAQPKAQAEEPNQTKSDVGDSQANEEKQPATSPAHGQESSSEEEGEEEVVLDIESRRTIRYLLRKGLPRVTKAILRSR